jgi:hypothetical protein
MTDLFKTNLEKYENPERDDERIVSLWLCTADLNNNCLSKHLQLYILIDKAPDASL